MKKTLLFILSMVLCLGMQAKVTLDFTNANEEWGIPTGTGSTSNPHDETEYTNGTYTISLGAPTTSGNGYYYNSGGYLMLCASGAYMKLPVFDFAVGTIVIGGHSNGSTSATMNIFVDDTAVSTECTDTSADHTYVINSNYQTVGTQYVYKNTSSKNVQVTYIDIYEVGEEVDGDGDGGGTTGGTGHGYEPDDPYTVSELIPVIEALSSGGTVSGVYVKGIVSEIYEISTSYGNMTYYISDDGTTTNQLEIYRGKSLNNAGPTTDSDIKVGDNVVVYGTFVNYNGTTPEGQTGNTYIYSLNGETSGDGGGTTGGTGHGYEADDPFTASEALALAQTLDSSTTLSGVYVKGTIVSVTELSTSYGNATYYISDDGSETNQFEIYRGYYLGNVKFTDEDQIQDGDEVVVYGNMVNYQGATPELTSGNYIYSLNGKTADDGGTTSGGTGHGYEADDPFTPSEAVALAETLDSSTTISGVYVKGIISKIDEISTSYGNATYYVSDDGSTSNQLEIYRGYYLDGEKFTSEDQIKVSDTVLVTGDLVNFYGNTPELTTGSKIVSIEEGDGDTSGNEPDPSLVRTLENSGVTAGSETATIDFTSQGLENETNVDEEVFTLSDGSTVVFAKADGNNAPMYYTNGTAVRVYALNTITFACSQEIAKIEMVCNSSQYLGNDTYTIEWSDTGAVYCNYNEDEDGEPKNSGGTQLRIQQIIVTYAGEAGEEDGISSVRSDVDGNGVMYNIGGQRVSDSYRGIVIVNGRKLLKK